MRLPSLKVVLTTVGAFGLAVWSLPTTTNCFVTHHDRGEVHHRLHAIPTMGQVLPTTGVDNSNPKPQEPKTGPVNKAPNRPANPGANGVVKPGVGANNNNTGNGGSVRDNAPTVPNPKPPQPGLNGPSSGRPGYSPYGAKLSKLRFRVIDGRSLKPLEGAEVVLIETEQRFTTGSNGMTQWIDAPVIRNPRYRPMVAELHGQLGAVVYKNGYRDSIHLGIRMHEGVSNETTVWMYKIGPGDRRVEPELYQVPYHRMWMIELADKFRRPSQPGEGPERP